MIISLILMTCLFDQAVLMLREIGCGSPLGLKGFTWQASHVTVHYYGLTTVARVEEVFTHCDSLGSWHVYPPLYRGVSLANGHKFMMGNDEIYPLILKASVFFFQWKRELIQIYRWKKWYAAFYTVCTTYSTSRPDSLSSSSSSSLFRTIHVSAA